MRIRVKKSILTLLVVMTVMMMSAATVHAAGTTTVKQAKKAYAAFLAKKGYMSIIGKSNVSKGDTVDFQLAYIGPDSVPELLVKYTYANSGSKKLSDGFIYTYRNGKVCLFEKLYRPYGYYKRKNLVVADSWAIRGQHTFTYMRPKARQEYCAVLSKSYRTGKSTLYHHCIANTNEGCITPSISAATFKTELKKLVGTTTLTKFAPVRYSYANRKRILGY